MPASFRFTFKLPKAISHEQRLQRCAAGLDKFAEEVSGLGGRLACLLVQLPPSLGLDRRVASTFFAMLRRRFEGGVACEPRHASWFTESADRLLLRHGISRVAADPALSPEAHAPGASGDWRYWRWHGSPRMYYSAYSEQALAQLASAVRPAELAGVGKMIIFDNTALGHAVADAALFQALLTRAGNKSGRERRAAS